ncbi:hypothetical protein YC2023_041389 [Brassica napus]
MVHVLSPPSSAVTPSFGNVSLVAHSSALVPGLRYREQRFWFPLGIAKLDLDVELQILEAITIFKSISLKPAPLVEISEAHVLGLDISRLFSDVFAMSFDFPGDTSFSEDRSSSIEIYQSFRLAGNLVDNRGRVQDDCLKELEAQGSALPSQLKSTHGSLSASGYAAMLRETELRNLLGDAQRECCQHRDHLELELKYYEEMVHPRRDHLRSAA